MTPDERLLALAKAGRITREAMTLRTDTGWHIVLPIITDMVTVGRNNDMVTFPAPLFLEWVKKNLPKKTCKTVDDVLSEMEKAA